MLSFRQVDVFSAEPWLGNPLAVVHDADGFAAPPLRRSGPVDAELRASVVRALGVTDASVEDMASIDNGPGWVGVDLG